MGQFSVTIYGHTGSVLSDNQQPGIDGLRTMVARIKTALAEARP